MTVVVIKRQKKKTSMFILFECKDEYTPKSNYTYKLHYIYMYSKVIINILHCKGRGVPLYMFIPSGVG